MSFYLITNLLQNSSLNPGNILSIVLTETPIATIIVKDNLPKLTGQEIYPV